MLDELLSTWVTCVKEDLEDNGFTGKLNVEYYEDEPCECECCSCGCDEPEENVGDDYKFAYTVADFYCGLIDSGLTQEEAMELTKYWMS